MLHLESMRLCKQPNILEMRAYKANQHTYKLCSDKSNYLPGQPNHNICFIYKDKNIEKGYKDKQGKIETDLYAFLTYFR